MSIVWGTNLLNGIKVGLGVDVFDIIGEIEGRKQDDKAITYTMDKWL